MAKLSLFALIAAAVSLGAFPAAVKARAPAEVHDARIIVELKGGTKGVDAAALYGRQDRLLDTIRDTITPSYEVRNRYVNVLDGFTLEVNARHVDKIRKLPGVARVNYDVARATRTTDMKLALADDEPATGETGDENYSAITMEKPEGTKEGEGTLIAILDAGFMLEHEAFTDLDPELALKVTQESLHDVINSSGFHGKPDVGHTTFWNNKVPFYYDYGGLSHDPTAPGEPDYDVFAEGVEHGTHVASIAAADGPYKGIAPKAQLALLKVFTEYIPTPEDQAQGYAAGISAFDSAILMGLEDAEKIGADVVNLSLGQDLNDFSDDSIVVRTIDRMTREGIFASTSAGNSGKDIYQKTGPYKNWTTDLVETGIMSYMGDPDMAMTIGAAQPDKMFYELALLVNGKNIPYDDQVTDYRTVDGDVTFDPERRLEDITEGGTHTEFGWVKVGGWGEEKDYADIEVDGKIAIVDRGVTTFGNKVSTAVGHGAIAVGIINNDPGETDFNFRMDFAGWTPPVPVVSILYRDRDVFDAGSGTLQIYSNKVAPNPTKRMMADFSSDGATYNLGLKPDICAPGVSVKGAVIDATDSYAYLDGTSMSAPNYAGALALLLSQDPTSSEWRDSLLMRTMSTAVPMLDKEFRELASVRQQGAGMVNIGAALNSEVFLEGLNAAGKGTGKAKIELKNGEDISQGKVDLRFKAHNESEAAVSYVATTYIYHPELTELSAELYPEYDGVKFQGTNDALIAKLTSNITVEAGESIIDLAPYTLSDEAKAELDANFANGTYLEGFVELAPEDSGMATLAIPWLGFYGDYWKEEPVEPFLFEREAGKVYDSDLVNSLCGNLPNTGKADFRSLWVEGYFDKFNVGPDGDITNPYDIMPVLLNQTNMLELTDSHARHVIPATTNPLDGSAGWTNDIYAGAPDATNMMLFQQFVTRSVYDNHITVTRKRDNKVVLEDVLIDPFYAEMPDAEGNIHYPLAKSIVSIDLVPSALMAHRAIGLITLYDIDTGKAYQDGEYTIRFEYELAADRARKYVKTYTLHVDSEAPAMRSAEKVTVGDKDYIRVRYDDVCLAGVAANGHTQKIKKDEDGFYVDIPIDQATSKDYLYLKSTDFAGNTRSGIFHLNDENKVAIESDAIKLANDFTCVIEDVSPTEKVLRITLIKASSGQAVDFRGTATISFKLFEGWDPNDPLKVYAVSGDKETLVDHTLVGDTVKVETKDTLSVRILTEPAGGGGGGTEIPEHAGPAPWVIPTVVVLSLAAAAGITVLAVVLVKRKKKTAN